MRGREGLASTHAGATPNFALGCLRIRIHPTPPSAAWKTAASYSFFPSPRSPANSTVSQATMSHSDPINDLEENKALLLRFPPACTSAKMDKGQKEFGKLCMMIRFRKTGLDCRSRNADAGWCALSTALAKVRCIPVSPLRWCCLWLGSWLLRSRVAAGPRPRALCLPSRVPGHPRSAAAHATQTGCRSFRIQVEYCRGVTNLEV